MSFYGLNYYSIQINCSCVEEAESNASLTVATFGNKYKDMANVAQSTVNMRIYDKEKDVKHYFLFNNNLIIFFWFNNLVKQVLFNNKPQSSRYSHQQRECEHKQP